MSGILSVGLRTGLARRLRFDLVIFAITFLAFGSVPTPAPAQSQRKYYLTKSVASATQAKTFCATGYHMASIFEIEQTTDIRYDTALGLTAGDSGSGPPIGHEVWARTGNPGANQSCNAWTSNHPSLQGYTFMLVYPNGVVGRQQFNHWVAQLRSARASTLLRA